MLRNQVYFKARANVAEREVRRDYVFCFNDLRRKRQQLASAIETFHNVADETIEPG